MCLVAISIPAMMFMFDLGGKLTPQYKKGFSVALLFSAHISYMGKENIQIKRVFFYKICQEFIYI